MEHDTSIIDRVYYGWLAVFLCRIWQTWLHIVDKTQILGHDSNSSIDRLTNENIEKNICRAFDDDYDYSLKYNVNLLSKSEEDEDGAPYVSANGKSQLHGMRVFDTISPSLSNCYFRVETDGNKKYLHKQTALLAFNRWKS